MAVNGSGNEAPSGCGTDAPAGPGFAAATQPVQAGSTIVTGAQGLRTGDARVTTASGNLPVYFAAPAGVRHPPLLLVVQEIFGVHEHIRDVCRRFAHAGYFAVAPELYFRQGDPSVLSEIPEIFARIVNFVPDAQVMADLDATVDWAQGQGGDAQRLGITGFCWGGRATWLYAVHSSRLRAAVAWYGRLDSPRTATTPIQPVDVAAQIRCPVLGLYGGADAGIPLASVQAMETALARNAGPGAGSRIVVYPDAPHAFHADYRPGYRAEAARDGWQRCLQWLATHGAGPG